MVKGKALDDSHLSFSGCTLRCTGGKLVPGSDGAVAVRQHVVRLWASKPDKAENVVPGTVTRQVFLGRQPRLHGRNGGRHAGARSGLGGREHPARAPSVWLDLPAERCRALSG